VKHKSTLLLVLTLGTILLTGCSQPNPPFCPEPVRADACTKAWLRTLSPPACAVDYFARVGVQQSVIEEECGK
jgi:hypothetical protein